MTCRECEQEIVNGILSAKETINLNKKLLGRIITCFFCEICLADYLEITKEELSDKVEQFKEQGCALF